MSEGGRRWMQVGGGEEEECGGEFPLRLHHYTLH